MPDRSANGGGWWLQRRLKGPRERAKEFDVAPHREPIGADQQPTLKLDFKLVDRATEIRSRREER
ncbi:MAG: hypothetical protein C4334_04255 [Pyrinomonas sp.]